MSKVINFNNHNQQNKEDFIDVPVPKDMEEIGRILDKIDLKELNGMDCLNEYAQLVEYAAQECQKNQSKKDINEYKYKDYNSALYNYLTCFNEMVNNQDCDMEFKYVKKMSEAELNLCVFFEDKWDVPEKYSEYYGRAISFKEKLCNQEHVDVKEVLSECISFHNIVDFTKEREVMEYLFIIDCHLSNLEIMGII